MGRSRADRDRCRNRRPGAVGAAVIALIGLLATPSSPARAYEGDHYAWTYYLALQVGFSERQAYQIACGAYAIDWDPDTGPMGSFQDKWEILRGEPGEKLRLIWLRFHAFHETLYEEMPGEVEAAKDRHQNRLLEMSEGQQNPGPLVHYVQDRHAHQGWPNIRGHAVVGHLPDFLSDDAAVAWQVTQDTLRELILFRDRHLSGDPNFTPRNPDLGRIREVLGRLLAANPVPAGSPNSREVRDRLPHELDATREGLVVTTMTLVDRTAALDWIVSLLGRYYPDVNVIKMITDAPLMIPSVQVINDAVREDKAAGLVPYFPDQEYGVLPPNWAQFDFDPYGRVAPAFVEESYGVEIPHFEVDEPTAEYRQVVGSPNDALVVTMRLPYSLDGLKTLEFLHPLPVIEISETSDFGVGGKNRPYLGNGQHTFERQIQRSRAELEAGRVVWKATIHAYGFEPVTKELTLDSPPPRDQITSSKVDELLDELRQAAGAATAAARDAAAACGAAQGTLDRLTAVRGELSGRLDTVAAGVQELATRAADLGQLLPPADAALLRGQRAAEELARLRDDAGRLRDTRCAPGASAMGGAADAGRLEAQASAQLGILEQSMAELRRLLDQASAPAAEADRLRASLDDLIAEIATVRSALTTAEGQLADAERLLDLLRSHESWAAGLRQPIVDALHEERRSEAEDAKVIEEMEGLYAQIRQAAASAPGCVARARSAVAAERSEIAALEARAQGVQASLGGLATGGPRSEIEQRLAELDASYAVAELFAESIVNRAREAVACTEAGSEPPTGDGTGDEPPTGPDTDGWTIGGEVRTVAGDDEAPPAPPPTGDGPDDGPGSDPAADLLRRAESAFANCDFVSARAFAQQAAAIDPDHPWVEANLQRIHELAEQQRRTANTLQIAQAQLRSGKLKDARNTMIEAARGAPGCMSRQVAQVVNRVEDAIQQKKTENQQALADGLGTLISALGQAAAAAGYTNPTYPATSAATGGGGVPTTTTGATTQPTCFLVRWSGAEQFDSEDTAWYIQVARVEGYTVYSLLPVSGDHKEEAIANIRAQLGYTYLGPHGSRSAAWNAANTRCSNVVNTPPVPVQ